MSSDPAVELSAQPGNARQEEQGPDWPADRQPARHPAKRFESGVSALTIRRQQVHFLKQRLWVELDDSFRQFLAVSGIVVGKPS